MKYNHHPFENQIFAHFRDQEDKIASAINLLKKNGYSVYKQEIKETKIA